LVETFRWGRGKPLRLAQGQIRFVVADRSDSVLIEMLADKDAAKSKARHAGDAANGQDRHPDAEEGIRAEIKSEPECETEWRRRDKRDSRLADHLFRHEAGKLLSVLTGIFGINRLQFAEDVVQESLVRALRTWPYVGIPKIRLRGSLKQRKISLSILSGGKTFFTTRNRRSSRS